MVDIFGISSKLSKQITDTITAYSFKLADFSVKLVKGEVGNVSQEIIDLLGNKLGSVEDNKWLTMLSAFSSAGVITEADAVQFYKIRNMAHPFDWMMYFVLTVKLFFNYITLQSETSMAKQSQSINKERRPYLPNYGDVINAAFIAPEKVGDIKEIMKRTGIPDEYIDLLFISKYSLYPVEVVKDLYLRGILTKDLMYERMRELGFTDTRIKEISQAWEVIPSPQDLFWMVGKEAFEPDMIQTIGLDDEFPVDQVHWLKKQGISEDWARKYWYAHWDEPSIGQGYEMLQRGVIGLNELDMLYRAVEIPPYWRDKLTQIAYRPLSRVDVRRMHKIGVLSEEELIKAYTDLGYNRDNAIKMTQFTVLYNQSTGSGVTKSQILSSYKLGMINRTDAKDLLLSIDVGEDQSEFLLYHEDYKRDHELVEKQIKNIGDKYKLGIINIIEVRSQLGKLNLLSERVELLVETWDIDKFEDTKIPSKTDLDKFYRNKIINRDEYYLEMKKLGYTETAVNWYLKLVELTTTES